jgi:hypothetical protein
MQISRPPPCLVTRCVSRTPLPYLYSHRNFRRLYNNVWHTCCAQMGGSGPLRRERLYLATCGGVRLLLGLERYRGR